jgi:hypothetical protein
LLLRDEDESFHLRIRRRRGSVKAAEVRLGTSLD